MMLYGYFRSSAVFRVRIALNLKGIPPELAFVHLRRNGGEQFLPGYVARNPQRLVPALETDGGEVLTQSLAIVEYLEEIHPYPLLLPGTAAERAWLRSIALAVACDIHPINNLRVLNRLRDAHGQDQPALDGWYAHWIATGMTAIEAMLRAHGSNGRFCHGDAPTLADVYLIPQVYNGLKNNCDMTPYPTVMSVFNHCSKLDPFARAFPEAQPDAE